VDFGVEVVAVAQSFRPVEIEGHTTALRDDGTPGIAVFITVEGGAVRGTELVGAAIAVVVVVGAAVLSHPRMNRASGVVTVARRVFTISFRG